MGQCVSRKAANAYAGSQLPGRPMARERHLHKHQRLLQDNDDELQQNQDDNKETSRRTYTRGVATSFGFKRRPASAIPVPASDRTDNASITKKYSNTDIIDNNGNDNDIIEPLETTSLQPSGRSTPRLAPPKKEGNTTRLNRFGFRNQSNRTTNNEYKNNNVIEKEKPKKSVSIAPTVTTKPKQSTTSIKSVKSTISQSGSIPTKLTFHTTSLPRPQLPVRISESKNAKTAANINRKVSTVSQRSDEALSSKEGSVTEDSGVGSHTSGTNSNFTGDSDTLHAIELMDSSPTFGRRNKNRPRRFEITSTAAHPHHFDVRDLDDSVEDGVVTEVAVIPLPRLPSVFATSTDSEARSLNSISTGIVRERTLEYEKNLEKNRRKISITSSEGFSEDYGEEEKSFRDRSCTEKAGQGATRLFTPVKTFRESQFCKSARSDKESSPTSSDDQDWTQGGEAMAEMYSISFSSSDESRDKEHSPLFLRTNNIMTMSSTRTSSSLMDQRSHPMTSSTGALPKDNNLRTVLLNRSEPKSLVDTIGNASSKLASESNSLSNSYHSNSKSNDATFRSVLLTTEDAKPLFTRLNHPNQPPSTILSSTMMTSSSSLSSTSSGTIPKDNTYNYKSLLLNMDDTAKPSPIPYTSELTSPQLTNSLLSGSKDQLKSVLLAIEDPKFAAVAAASSGTLLDDETSPVDSLLSSYTESEEMLFNKMKSKNKNDSTDSKDVNEKSPLSPASPGTPTNASLSLSEGRDFLIDDEIADQPGLVFDETININLNLRKDDFTERLCSEQQNGSDSIATLVESTPKLARKVLKSCEGSPALMRPKNPLLSRTASVDTLSPCESIASDDMMMDFEYSQSSGIDDSSDRLHLNETGALHSLDGATIRSELEHQDASVAREWSSLLGTHSNRDSPSYSVVRSNNYLRSRTNTPSSVPDSPRAHDRTGLRGNLPASSPLLRSARTTHGSPVAYDSDDSLRLDRITHGSMVNDIVGIKTMLLKLKRVLQETDEDNLMRNEPHNPFDNQQSVHQILKNGLYNGLTTNDLNATTTTNNSDLDSLDSIDLSNNTTSASMELAEMRRQIEFLQTQLEDKDRAVQQLQNQVTKYTLDKHQREDGNKEMETCNAATQTDRVRPLSAGPSLLQSLPNEGGMGPLVSANEHSRRSRPQSLIEPSLNTSSPSAATSSKIPPLKLWRKPGEPPPPIARHAVSSLPRRARSRSRPS